MFNLLKVYLLKEYWETKNNKFKLFTGLFFNILVLVVLYRNFTTSNDGFIYILLIASTLLMILSSFITMGEIVVEEYDNGTIYSLIMAPYSLTKFLIARIAINNISNVAKLTLILFFSIILMDSSPSFDYLAFILVLFIGNLGLYGIGFILASISIVSNEIKYLSNIARIIFVYALLMFDCNIFIPFSYAKKVLSDILLGSHLDDLINYPPTFIFKFIVNTLGFFIVGMIIFKYTEEHFISKNISPFVRNHRKNNTQIS